VFSRMIRGSRTGTRGPREAADRVLSPSAKVGSTLRTVCGQDIAQLCKSCSFLLTGEVLECEENGSFERFSRFKVAERMGFELPFYRLSHVIFGF
jgi:hypothetical protein